MDNPSKESIFDSGSAELTKAKFLQDMASIGFEFAHKDLPKKQMTVGQLLDFIDHKLAEKRRQL